MKLTELLFGSPDHPGIAEKITLLAGALFAGSAGEGAIAGGSAIAEGRFSGFMNGAMRVLDLAVDAQILTDVFNFSRSAKGGIPQGQQEVAVMVRNALKSHGLFRQQLEAHKGKKAIAERLAEYVQSGIHLPSEDVLNKTFKSLRVVLHPDKNKNSVESKQFFQTVTEAHDMLLKPEIRKAYAEAVSKSMPAMEKLYADMKGKDWEKFHNSENQLKLGFEGKNKIYSKAQVWVSKLKGYQKIGLAFGAVTSVALASSLVARITGPKKSNEAIHEGDPEPLRPPREAVMGAFNGGVSGGILAVGGSVAHTLFTAKNAGNLRSLVMRKVHTTHFLPVVAFTAGFAALGAAVRVSDAHKRNARSFVELVQTPPDMPDAAPAR